MVKYFIFVMLAGLVVCFQNCSGKEFSPRTDLNKSTSLDGSEQLVPEEEPSPNDDGSVNGGNASGGSASGGSASAGSTSAGSNNEDDSDDVVENEDDDEVAENEDDDKDSADGKKICMRHGVKMNATDIGVCILEGNGKSNRVAVINDEIIANNSTPKTVCMSALACRKIVDAKFKVVTLEKRGYCNNDSAHTVRLSDEQIRTLIDKIQ